MNVWPKALGTNALVSIRHTQKNLGPGLVSIKTELGFDLESGR